MSKLSKAERDKLPLSDFADPDRRLYPIVDESDVADAAALLGKAKNPEKVKARIIAIAKRKGFALPKAWQDGDGATHSRRSGMGRTATVDFDDTGRYVDGDWAIYPHALLFEAGDYPDKGFSISPEEMLLAVESFSPVGGNIEHTPFMDGRACEVRSIRLDESDSFRLRGEVAVPLWLDEQLSAAERKLSCEWDRTDKTLRGIALTVQPRIPDASLMSAYAAFARPRRNTPTGRRHLQMLHDITVEHGATCGSGAQMGQFASAHEARTIQQIHDMTVEHGARCETMDNVRDNGGSGGDVVAAPMIYSAPQKERKRMNLDFKALFSGLFGAIEEREQNPPPQPPSQPVGQPVLAPARAQDIGTVPYTVQTGANPSVTSGASTYPVTSAPSSGTSPADPRIAELEKQLAERDATIAREAEARIQREAAIFAEEQVRAQKATPAEQEKLALTFAQAMRDDQRSGSVTFGEGDGKQTTSRVQQLRDVYEARPAGLLTQQMLPDGQNGQQASAVFNKQTTERTGPDGKKVEGPVSAERRRALLEGSSLGRTIVRDEGAASRNGKN